MDHAKEPAIKVPFDDPSCSFRVIPPNKTDLLLKEIESPSTQSGEYVNTPVVYILLGWIFFNPKG